MQTLLGPGHRWSGIMVLAATMVGFCLRVYPVGRLGFEHFDEGIYALAATWALMPTGLQSLDPLLIPYAPPAYVILVGIGYGIVGFSDQVALLVSAVAGTLTIPVLARIASSFHGPSVGAIVGWSVCCAGPHIAFSRMGLTDASFVLAWGLAFAAGKHFLRNPGWRTALWLGLVVGTCQQFKYNGWLFGGFVVVAGTVDSLCSLTSGGRAWSFRVFGWGSLAAAIAALVVLPWYLFVERHGGYAALLAHQRSYLGGLSSWPVHLRAQAEQAVALGGPAALLGLAGGGILLSIGEGANPRRLGTWCSRLAVLLLLPLLTNSIVTGCLACCFALDWRRSEDRFLGISWIGFSMLAPFYHPYARLWLPGELLQWLLLGSIAARLLDPRRLPESQHLSWRGRGLVCGLVISAAGFLVHGPGFPIAAAGPIHRPGLMDPSDSLRLAAREVLHALPPGLASIRTLVRPAMSFYLAGQVGMDRMGSLDQLAVHPGRGEWALVDSVISSPAVESRDDPARRRVIEPMLPNWEVALTVPAKLSLTTTLDLDPGYARAMPANPEALFWLLRPKTPGSGR